MEKQTPPTSNIVSLSSYRKTDAPIKKAKSSLNSLSKLEGELIYRTTKLVEKIDEQEGRILNLEKTVEHLLHAIQILASRVR